MTAPAAGPAPGTAVRRGRLPLATVVTGSIVVTMLRPVTWALGLLGFLAGGGLLLVAWPIVVLPSPAGLQNLLATPVVSLVFGSVSQPLLLAIAGGIAGSAALLVAGILLGAWAERQGIGVVLEAAPDDGLERPAADLDGAPGTGRIALVRLLALAPVAVAVALAWQPVYDAAYHELILPGDLAVPLPIRVIDQVPGQVLGIALAWLVSDAAAALGVRRLVLERRPVLVAWLLGWLDVVRRPQRVLPTAFYGLGVIAVLVVPALLTASVGWERIREILVGGDDPVVALVATLIWVAIWLGGLVLAGLGAAIRAAAWTLEIPVSLPVEVQVPAAGPSRPAAEPSPV